MHAKFFTERFQVKKKTDQELVIEWLQSFGVYLIANPPENIDQQVEHARNSNNPNIIMTRYRLSNPIVNPLFALPEDISVAKIMAVLTHEKIEITLNNPDSAFHGCRLRLEKLPGEYEFLPDNGNAANMIVGNMLLLPFILLAGPRESNGFAVILDASPKPSWCLVS